MTPAGTSNELDVQNEWEENTTHTRRGFWTFPTSANRPGICNVCRSTFNTDDCRYRHTPGLLSRQSPGTHQASQKLSYSRSWNYCGEPNVGRLCRSLPLFLCIVHSRDLSILNIYSTSTTVPGRNHVSLGLWLTSCVTGQGKFHFPCSADHEQDWQPCPVDACSCYICDHTYIQQ